MITINQLTAGCFRDKKIKIAVVLTVLIICLVYPVTYSTDISIVGLSSSNSRIVVQSENIAVFSHPTLSSYFISSATLISALISNNGYTLTYLDENLEETTVSNVLSGCILATKGEEKIQIPIVAHGAITQHTFGTGGYLSQLGGSTCSNINNIAGKNVDDKSYSFLAGDSATTTFDRYEYTVTADLKSYVFNIYADGNAIAQINYRYSSDSYILVKWTPDGKIYYNENGTLVVKGTLARNRWHRVAIIYDQPRSRYQIYIDGVMYTNNSVYYSDATKYLFGISGGSTDGKVAYDDLISYNGYYYSDYEKVSVSTLSDDLAIDENNQIIYAGDITTFAELIENIKYDADNLVLWNENEAKTNNELSDDITLAMGKNASYTYYKIKPAFYVENFAGSCEDGKASASAEFINMLNISKTATMILVLKDANGAIVSVYSSNTATITSTGTTVSITEVEASGYKAEVFFINNWDERIGLSDKIISIN